MNEQKKKELQERLASLDKREQHKIYKRAAMLRKATSHAKTRTRAVPEDDDESPVYLKKRETLDDWVLKILQQDEPATGCADGEKVTGVCVWIGKKACRVRIPGAEIDCQMAGEIERAQQTLIAVGDDVVVARTEQSDVVRQVLPRKTSLSRPDPDNPNLERLVVANVDVVVITVSVKTPPLHPRLIDRYLVAIQRGNATPVICVNKLDLLEDPAERALELNKLAPYEGLGAEITTCSTTTFEGMAKLRQVVEGKTCAFVGHSGVGKSSIINAITDLKLDTGGVSEGYGRGRHTTTASSLYYLPGGTRLIDTPGIRSFGLWDMGPAQLCWYFPEFVAHVGGCKFSDCTHRHEPECGVKAAVANGLVSALRYETYLRLLKE
ncbi:MAG TPA: ribosome small subunit-dependent GTPase A [Fimbriimonadaceae bacterium]